MKSLLILVLLCPVILLAQKQGQQAIDSMTKMLPAAKEDTNKVKLLNALSYSYSFTNPDDGIKCGQQALGLAEKLNWQSGIGEGNNYIGINYYYKSGYASAMAYYSKAISIYKAIDDEKMIAEVLNNMSKVYTDKSDFAKAMDCSSKALKITEETGDKVANKNSLTIIGNIYYMQSDYPKALEYYFRSLKISEEISDKRGIATNLIGIGNVYNSQKDYLKALEYYTKDLKIAEETGNKEAIAAVNTNIGCLYTAQNDPVKALGYFFTALKIEDAIGKKNNTAIISANIGSCYTSLKNYTLAIAYEKNALKIAEETGEKYVAVQSLLFVSDAYLGIVKDPSALQNVKMTEEDQPNWIHIPVAAIPTSKPALLLATTDQLQRGVAIAKELNTPELIQACYEHLAEAYTLSGDYKQALEYANNGRVIKDSLFSSEDKIKITNLETKRDLDLKEKQIQLDKLDLAKRHNERFFFITAIILLITIGLLFINRQLLKHRKVEAEKKNAELWRSVAEKGKDHATHLLNERVKELSTIYMANNILLDESKNIADVFNEIVNLLPPGWQYPDVCAGRIVFDGNEYTTLNYAPSSFKQDAPIKTQDGRAGLIEVVYTRQMPNEAEGPFLKEERDLINTLADIIEVYFNKKAHQDALVQSEANLKTIFDTTDTGYVLVDKKLKIIASNKFATDFANNEIGVAEDGSDNLADFFLDKRRPIIEKLIPEVFNGKNFNYDANYPQPDGSIHWYNVRLTPITGHEKKVLGLMIAIDNITERKEAEDALKKSEANLKSIFDTTHVSYLLLDANLTVVAYNQHIMNWYSKFTGVTLRVGENFLDQARPERRENVKKMYGDVIATSTPVEYETIYTNGKETMYLTVTLTPVISNAKTIGICITGHDITNRKLIEIERQKMIKDLLQRNRDLEQFTYIISHNVRGPLATMLGLNSLLKEAPVDENLGYIVDGIGNSAEKLDDVIRDLNEILHIRNDSSQIKQEVNLYEETESVKKSIALLINKSKTVIECDFSAISNIVTIKSYLSSIFYNLITNAIKFAKTDITPEIKIWSEKHGDQVCIRVRDNGMGLDTYRYSDRIFGLYQRFHPHVEGKGLGLFMTKTQVEVLNGTIEIDSEPGHGTTFNITFQEQFL